MNQKYQAAQGSIIPTMFIGLGGVGSCIVDRIAGRAKLLPNWESQLRQLNAFVSIDTNELDQHKLKDIPEGSRMNIAAFDKAKAIKNFKKSEDIQALQWIDPGYEPRAGFKPGAGQIRVESRLGFFFYSPEIRKRFEGLVEESLRPGVTWRQSKPPKFNVYLFCTLAGGTGSGSYLSTAYLIEEIISAKGWQPRIIGNLLLSTLMTEKVEPSLHPDIHANSYAGLKELEHLTKLDYKQVRDEGRDSEEFVYCRDPGSREVTTVRSRPFFLSFIFDRPPHISLPDPVAAIADAAYLQIFTPIINNLAGQLDNYEKNLEGLTRFPGEFRDVGLGYAKNYGAFGAVAMLVPGIDVLEYCSLRFAAHAIRSQITFGLSSSDPSDTRARALAKLGVDYSDPKFLNKSDEARERDISRAFVTSVREMARQDVKQDLEDGFWNQLVQSVDEGKVAGRDEKGAPKRAESLTKTVERKLLEERVTLLNKVSIKERAFTFHKEGVNQYIEQVNRLSEDIRASREIVDEGLLLLKTAARDGEVITLLELDPITERYLITQLLKLCESDWIPDAQGGLEKTKKRDITNPRVAERLDKELFSSLQEAAARGGILKRRDDEFFNARDEAQEYYRSVAAAARKFFDATIRIAQLRSLLEYLKERSLQYTRLATRMDSLVQDLERGAERLRRGETAVSPSFALRVEVFETLDEPRRRIWDKVYEHLFLNDGRYITTFDRNTLSESIRKVLMPEVRADGIVSHKTLEQTVADLRETLVDLGRDRLRPRIFGDSNEPGLDMVTGIEIESQIILKQGKKEGEPVEEKEKSAYRDKKFRALAQMAGVMARLSSAESEALDDGVIINRSRQLIHGLGRQGENRGAESFMDRLLSTLSEGGKQVNVDEWHDQQLLIVHDTETPIPLYYFNSIINEIEESYIKQASFEKRGYNLHTDFNWEKSLPNLNPRRSEITIGWALQALTKGLLTKIIKYRRDQKKWEWIIDNGKTEELGPDLSVVLYKIGEIHRKSENMQMHFQKQIEEIGEAMTGEEKQKRKEQLIERCGRLIFEIESRALNGSKTRVDVLEEPILRVLEGELKKMSAFGLAKLSSSSDDDRYLGF